MLHTHGLNTKPRSKHSIVPSSYTRRLGLPHSGLPLTVHKPIVIKLANNHIRFQPVKVQKYGNNYKDVFKYQEYNIFHLIILLFCLVVLYNAVDSLAH